MAGAAVANLFRVHCAAHRVVELRGREADRTGDALGRFDGGALLCATGRAVPCNAAGRREECACARAERGEAGQAEGAFVQAFSHSLHVWPGMAARLSLPRTTSLYLCGRAGRWKAGLLLTAVNDSCERFLLGEATLPDCRVL